MNIDDRIKELEKLETNTKYLLKELREVKLTDSDKKYNLAIILHDKFCHHNHTDGCCGWHYEIENKIHLWNFNTHNYWYGIVCDTINKIPDINLDTIIKVVNAL